MRFLFKVAFWLTIVLLLLPSGKSQGTTPGPGAGEAVTAVGAAVSDMRQFCARQPDACTVGSQAASALGHKAQNGAKMIYDFLTERLGPNEPAPAAKKVSDRPAAPHTSKPAQNTLTPADLAPTWRGPEPRKDAQARRPA